MLQAMKADDKVALVGNTGVENLEKEPPKDEYMHRLEQRLKEHKRRKQLDFEEHAESMLPRPDEAEKQSLDPADSLMSFSGAKIAGIASKNGNVKAEETTPVSKPTLSTSPGPIPLPLPSKPPISLIKSTEKKNSTSEDNGLTDIVSGIWDKVKGMVGFTPDCQNQGTKKLGGKCYCPQYFSGEFCESKQCINRGVLIKTDDVPPQELCKCPHPQYVTGNHCETVHCQNGGKPFANGTCKCIDNWYTGEFCEYYASSWFAVLGIPLLFIAVIALCCVICRLDFCPKRSAHRHDTRRRNRGPPPSRRHLNPDRDRHRHRFDDPQTLMIQENLLNDCQQHLARNQVVRLENIPVYNPRIPSMPNDEFKPLEPPPSYDQAVSNCPSLNSVPPISHALQTQSQMPQPPMYTAQDNRQIPPPPDFMPPNPPRNRGS